jgi:hypothetical protein
MANTNAPGADWVEETSPRIADRVSTLEAALTTTGTAVGVVGDIVAETYGGSAAAGATGRWADAGHKHALGAQTIPAPRVAAGVPSGAPTAGENGIAFDTTASTGGLYAWNGSAWVKGSTIP